MTARCALVSGQADKRDAQPAQRAPALGGSAGIRQRPPCHLAPPCPPPRVHRHPACAPATSSRNSSWICSTRRAPAGGSSCASAAWMRTIAALARSAAEPCVVGRVAGRQAGGGEACMGVEAHVGCGAAEEARPRRPPPTRRAKHGCHHNTTHLADGVFGAALGVGALAPAGGIDAGQVAAPPRQRLRIGVGPSGCRAGGGQGGSGASRRQAPAAVQVGNAAQLDLHLDLHRAAHAAPLTSTYPWRRQSATTRACQASMPGRLRLKRSCSRVCGQVVGG